MHHLNVRNPDLHPNQLTAACTRTDNGNCDDAANDDENVAGKELKPSRQLKRKNNSSAPEILTYTYT